MENAFRASDLEQNRRGSLNDLLGATFGFSPLSATSRQRDRSVSITARRQLAGRLTSAAVAGDMAACSKLLGTDHGLIEESDLNRYTILIASADSGQAEIVTMLLEMGANVNAKDGCRETSLYKATRKGHTEVVRRLLGAPAIDANACTTLRATALHEAAARGRTDIIALLLARKGISIDPRDAHGVTPLQAAAAEDQQGAVQALLTAGADPNHQDMDGLSPLHVAAFEGHVAILQLLLAHGGVQTDSTNCNGHSALHLAYANLKNEAAKVLLKAGANPDLPDKVGLTPNNIKTAHENPSPKMEAPRATSSIFGRRASSSFTSKK